MKKYRDNIQRLCLRGDVELGMAIGVSSRDTLARLRQEGLPCYHDGKSFVYFPNDVEKWLREHWDISDKKVISI